MENFGAKLPVAPATFDTIVRMKGLLAVLVFGIAASAQTPAVSSGGVLNAASFDRQMPVTPGALISIFGSNLAATTALADSIPLSTVLGGVNVKVNGVDAPLTGVFPSANGDQINAQLPWNVQSGSAQVVVTRNGVASAPQSFQVAQFSPGIFSVQFGVGQAIAINLDGSLAAPAGSIPGLATHPAKAGDTIIILATGLGPVTPPLNSGANSTDTLRTTVTTPTVLIGGVSAPVAFSGLSPQFVGVNQVNVTVPAGVTPGGAVPLQISMGGLTSTNQVTIAVQ
jgi:uncharacterized protein (TIGR03437 family)